MVWWRVGFAVGAGALQGTDFNQLCVGRREAERGPGEELGSLALPSWGLPWTLVTLGDEGGEWIRFSGEQGLSNPAAEGVTAGTRACGGWNGPGQEWRPVGVLGKGYRTGKGFCLPLFAAEIAAAKEKVEACGPPLTRQPPPRPVSEVAELQKPVPESLT